MFLVLVANDITILIINKLFLLKYSNNRNLAYKTLYNEMLLLVLLIISGRYRNDFSKNPILSGKDPGTGMFSQRSFQE